MIGKFFKQCLMLFEGFRIIGMNVVVFVMINVVWVGYDYFFDVMVVCVVDEILKCQVFVLGVGCVIDDCMVGQCLYYIWYFEYFVGCLVVQEYENCGWVCSQCGFGVFVQVSVSGDECCSFVG